MIRKLLFAAIVALAACGQSNNSDTGVMAEIERGEKADAQAAQQVNAGKARCADMLALIEQNDIAESDLVPKLSCELLNCYRLTGAHPILLASGTNYRVRHGQCLIGKLERR